MWWNPRCQLGIPLMCSPVSHTQPTGVSPVPQVPGHRCRVSGLRATPGCKSPAVHQLCWLRDTQTPLQQLLKSQSHPMQGDFLPSPPPPPSQEFPPSSGADSSGPSPVTLCSAPAAPCGSGAPGLPSGASLPIAAPSAAHALISPKGLGRHLIQREGTATLQQPAGCHHQGPSTRTSLQEPELSSKPSQRSFLTVPLQFSPVLHPQGPCAAGSHFCC